MGEYKIGLCGLVLLVKQGTGERKDDELSVSAGYDGRIVKTHILNNQESHDSSFEGFSINI